MGDERSVISLIYLSLCRQLTNTGTIPVLETEEPHKVAYRVHTAAPPSPNDLVYWRVLIFRQYFPIVQNDMLSKLH